MQIKSLLVLATVAAGVLAAVDPSTPSVGQQSRYRALPRGSNLAIVPVDGAEFLAGTGSYSFKFDISVELHSETGTPDISALSFTINGKQVKDVIAFVRAQKTTFAVARASWRNLASPASGEYNVELSVGSEKVKAKWVVRGSSTRKAKNALLFIGDGMAPSMIAAARYISKNTKFGKFDNGDGFLEMEKWDSMGKIATNGIDSIITDSANSAASYTSGQKGWVNTLSVYADTTTGDQLDDAKVETLAEVIRRVRPGMCIASMWGHTRSRGQGDILVDQALNGFKHYVQTNSTTNTWPVKPDVLLGGGGEFFKGSRALNKTDYYAAYASAGYNVVYNKAELNSPGLEFMTLKAIEIMEKKSASIDKSMHPMDYDRGLADLLEFDRTLKAVRAHTCAKDTAIFLTADHSQGYDVYGSVDLTFFRSASNDDSVGPDGSANLANPGTWHAEQRNSIGIYQDAGWIDNVLDSNGLPTKFADARFRLAGGKVDQPTHVENFEVKDGAAGTNPLTRNPSVALAKVNGTNVIKSTTVYVADPHDSVNSVGLARAGNLPANSGSSVHTLQTVDLYCFGPGVASCGKTMDNTELFFLIADVLGLGDKPDTYTPSAPANADKYNTYSPAANAPYNAPGSNSTAPKNLYSSAASVGVTAAVFAAVALLL
ncbi:alkaline-phosphatase-like protein [Obelidium mucronatum]|nr:alkaline-phosphatase-like protein [Obelidium mucronatum]